MYLIFLKINCFTEQNCESPKRLKKNNDETKVNMMNTVYSMTKRVCH